MVKFSKQFEGQLVPEWKEAFVDYWKLKKDLKKIHLLNTPSHNPSPSKAETFLSSLRNFAFAHHGRDRHRVIQVHKKLASSASKEDVYETELWDQLIDSEAAKEFFTCLDFQLNKVNQFYKSKEKEFLDRGESLRRQVEILVDLQSAIKEQRHKGAGSQDSQEDPSITCTLSCEEESSKGRAEQVDLQQDSSPNDYSDLSKNPVMDSPRAEEAPKHTPRTMNWQDSKLRSLSSRSFSCHGKNLKINIPLTTPSRTLAALGDLVFEDLISPSAKKCGPEGRRVHINKNRLHHAEKMIRGALVELHKGLGYLNTYRNLNMLAFVKILKKFDKVTGKEVLPIYLKVVETSYFNCSDKVMSLADEVEELFAKHFVGEDRRKALRYLRPHHRKDTHGKTFFIGLFTGCLVALFTGYVIMAHITGMYRRQGDSIYMETVYPILSMFSLMFLHLFLYGCNIFAWRKARINYSFILELCPTKELKYRDVFLICSASMTLVVGVMLAHLCMLTKGYSFREVQAIPGLLLLAFLLVIVCPLNIFYQSSRCRLLRVIRNIVLTPFYKVLMLDFFMADQLCSQVPMLRNLEYVACYFMTGSYKTQDYGYCMRVKHYQDLAYAVSFLPYYWRAMQCARRWFDEGEMSHLVNLGKYVSAMLAAGAKVAYEKERTIGWLCLVVTVSTCATVYQLYWDFVKDWGLLQPHSKNPWLRNELMLRRKFVYYLSMGLNLLLRLAWLQSVLHYSFGRVDYRVTSLFLAALEVIRRGLWNFYRLENEHLNNAGKFRAVKTVPLPFHEVDEED